MLPPPVRNPVAFSVHILRHRKSLVKAFQMRRCESEIVLILQPPQSRVSLTTRSSRLTRLIRYFYRATEHDKITFQLTHQPKSQNPDGVADDQENYGDPPPSFPKHGAAGNPQTSSGEHSNADHHGQKPNCSVRNDDGLDDFCPDRNQAEENQSAPDTAGAMNAMRRQRKPGRCCEVSRGTFGAS